MNPQEFVSYVVYEPSGRISSYGRMQREHLTTAAVGDEQVLEAEGDPKTHYVDPVLKQVFEKEPSTAWLDGSVVRGLPSPAWVTAGGSRTEVTSGWHPAVFPMHISSITQADNFFA